MRSFLDIVDQARDALQRSEHISLRALKRQYSLDDESLADLVEELVEVHQVADRDGNVLVWRRASPVAPTESPATPTAKSVSTEPTMAPQGAVPRTWAALRRVSRSPLWSP